MTASQLIAQLSQRGVRIEPTGDRLRYSPSRKLTPELLDALHQHKQIILAVLQSPDVELAIAWQTALDDLQINDQLDGKALEACRRAEIRRD